MASIENYDTLPVDAWVCIYSYLKSPQPIFKLIVEPLKRKQMSVLTCEVLSTLKHVSYGESFKWHKIQQTH